MSLRQRTFLGHPLGLYVLFFTEMWERFSYYGMRALLILYMVNYFKWAQQEASNIYKIYTSLVYVTPIIGGFLADRFLGNRMAVIIGAILMAIGHFLMAFEDTPIFYAALIFLIIGNGFFKPNMSTQVGRLYPTNDGRRDGAYTIFYMGINLGAFLAPLACGWLAERTVGQYHSGFTLAGIGMVIGLVTYLIGQPLLKEIEPGSAEDRPIVVSNKPTRQSTAMSEAEAERTPSVLGFLHNLAPTLLVVVGVVMIVAAPMLYAKEVYGKRLPLLVQQNVPGLGGSDAAMLGIAGVSALITAWVAAKVRNAVRDRVLAILAVGVFVVFFWAAFEQAGNVQNLWADKSTQRYLTRPATEPGVVPEVVEDKSDESSQAVAEKKSILTRFTTMFRLKEKSAEEQRKEQEKKGQSIGQWLGDFFNPVPTTWFQSINALAIFVIAPIFAFMWIFLDSRGLQPSIPMKMFLGLFFMSAAMAIMLGAANQENKHSNVAWKKESLPAGIIVNDKGEVCHQDGEKTERYFAGRLKYDSAAKTLNLMGVLPDTERDRIIRDTAPKEYAEAVDELKKKAEGLTEGASVSITLDKEPSGFDWRYAGLKKSEVEYDAATRTITAKKELAEKEIKAILKAGGDPDWRNTINDLFKVSQQFQVSWQWLLWSYILATLGELCLSPVGLSMVSKLAPKQYATLLMGMWMLTSSFGNFVAGLSGEHWGTIPPTSFFLWVAAIVAGAALVLLVLVRKINGAMHGVT